MRILVIIMLVLIVGSLGSALWFLIRDKGKSDRTVKALTVRISLSIALFLLLMAATTSASFPDRPALTDATAACRPHRKSTPHLTVRRALMPAEAGLPLYSRSRLIASRPA